MTIIVAKEQSSAVSEQFRVEIPIDNDAANELRNALNVVQRYEKKAINAIKEKTKASPLESDWHNVSYGVKNDRVIVTVKDGMAG